MGGSLLAMEAAMHEAQPRHSSCGARNLCLFLLSVMGGTLIVVGALWWWQPPNEYQSMSWHGPVQCIAISSQSVRVREAACGPVQRSGVQFPVLHDGGLMATRRIDEQRWRNCTVCNTLVACGATERMPNLVDGMLRILPTNMSSLACMRTGQSFTGYYKRSEPDQISGILSPRVKVQLAATVEQALYTDQLRQIVAPFILGTGRLAVLGSVAYIVYKCLRVGMRDDGPQVSYADCWGPSPTWRSEYAMVKGGMSSKEGDDICCVCLSARCGEVRFVECGHAVVCLTCSTLLRHCPVCSEPIESIHIDQNVLL